MPIETITVGTVVPPTTPPEEAKPELTPEEIALEQRKAQAFDLVSTVKLLDVQARRHEYYNRPDEVQAFNKFSDEMAAAGTPIPRLEQKKTLTINVTLELDYTPEVEAMLPLIEGGSRPELNYRLFEDWWNENIKRDRSKFLKWVRDNKVGLRTPIGSNTHIKVQTKMTEWPDKELYELGMKVISEAKGRTNNNDDETELF